MQQRRLRLGDIVDDYCPRERRITNHVIVAMIEDEVKQTRCSTCEADHEYKQARVPAQRKKKDASGLDGPGDGPAQARVVNPEPLEDNMDELIPEEPAEAPAPESPAPLSADGEQPPPPSEDEGPVHRRLIRATLPRPEGQAPERKMPDFTVRQPGQRRFDKQNVNGNHAQQHRRRGRGHHAAGNNPQERFGGQRQGGGGQRQGGNRSGAPGSPRHGGRHGGQGRKRGR